MWDSRYKIFLAQSSKNAVNYKFFVLILCTLLWNFFISILIYIYILLCVHFVHIVCIKIAFHIIIYIFLNKKFVI